MSRVCLRTTRTWLRLQQGHGLLRLAATRHKSQQASHNNCHQSKPMTNRPAAPSLTAASAIPHVKSLAARQSLGCQYGSETSAHPQQSTGPQCFATCTNALRPAKAPAAGQQQERSNPILLQCGFCSPPNPFLHQDTDTAAPQPKRNDSFQMTDPTASCDHNSGGNKCVCTRDGCPHLDQCHSFMSTSLHDMCMLSPASPPVRAAGWTSGCRAAAGAPAPCSRGDPAGGAGDSAPPCACCPCCCRSGGWLRGASCTRPCCSCCPCACCCSLCLFDCTRLLRGTAGQPCPPADQMFNVCRMPAKVGLGSKTTTTGRTQSVACRWQRRHQ